MEPAAFVTLLSVAAAMYFTRYRHGTPIHDPSSSAVFITGGARGIGRDTAIYLISKGYSVLVTVRKQSQYDEMKTAAEKSNNGTNTKQPYPILLDVTNDEQIPTAMKQLQNYLNDHNKNLIAVVNNAGINPEGDKINEGETYEIRNELADPTTIGRRVFETNVIGVGRVTKACLPILTKSKSKIKSGSSGTTTTIVNIGSYFGSIAGALGLDHCYYEASKFALEGMSDNMRRSLRKDGVRVVLVKPGNIMTDMNSAGEDSAKVVAMDIEHAISSSKPKARYYPGRVKGYSTKFVCRLYEMLPTSIVDKL